MLLYIDDIELEKLLKQIFSTEHNIIMQLKAVGQFFLLANALFLVLNLFTAKDFTK